jgi:hypothetical protein
MPSSVEDFRRLLYKDLALPSGLSVQIRKVQAWDFLGLGELPVPQAAEKFAAITMGFTEDDSRSLRRYTDRAMVRGVVKPPLTDAMDAGGEPVYLPDRLHVTELSPDDYGALANAILQWSGLVAEEAQAIESFREDSQRTPGESIGGAVPLLAK